MYKKGSGNVMGTSIKEYGIPLEEYGVPDILLAIQLNGDCHCDL